MLTSTELSMTLENDRYIYSVHFHDYRPQVLLSIQIFDCGVYDTGTFSREKQWTKKLLIKLSARQDGESFSL